MSYGNVHNKSTFHSGKDYCSLEGEGSVHSNDLEIARELSSGLADCVSHGNQIVYEAHAKLKGWKE